MSLANLATEATASAVTWEASPSALADHKADRIFAEARAERLARGGFCAITARSWELHSWKDDPELYSSQFSYGIDWQRGVAELRFRSFNITFYWLGAPAPSLLAMHIPGL